LELLGSEGSEGFDRGIFTKKFGCNAVDVDIGRLGRKDGCDQKLPGARVGERTGNVGIELVKALQDFGDALRSEWFIGFRSALRRYRRGFAPYTIIFPAARLLGRCFPGREPALSLPKGRPRNAVLAAGGRGLTGNYATWHEATS
jgi:hypothetical protein